MNVLLVEPNYKNKYPPIGLMKISAYHKQRGDNVVFYKGIMSKEVFKQYNFSRVYITSLFTFYYKMTENTIKKYQKLIDSKNIFIGGITASIMAEKLKKDIGPESTIVKGLLTDSAVLGLDKGINIDILPPDFLILEDVTYEYPTSEHYISYTTRGCVNKCHFCAVPILEPTFHITNNIVKQIEATKGQYNEKQNLLLMDNNILGFSETELSKIVDDIYKLGFDGKTKFYTKLPLQVYLEKLNNIPKYNPG